MKRTERGYTIVEIMSALTLFAIGAAGVIGMQRVTIQGGADARNFDTGTNIAKEWEARLQRDAAVNWTMPDSTTSVSNIDQTTWLKSANIGGTDWHLPAAGPVVPGYSRAFDILGHDIAPASVDRMFCVQYRLGWIAPPTTVGGDATTTAILRAEIRVFWARIDIPAPDCDSLSIDTAAEKNKYYFVYLTTALRGNPTQ